MNIVPEKVEYNFEVMKHTARASLEHVAGVRKVSYFFDEKLIGERVVEDGRIMTDDDCIADILNEYSDNNTGVYADIYKNHKDKIQLVNKMMHMTIDAGAFKVNFSVKCEKESYTFSVTTNNGKDRIVCKMEANDFVEAYEKSRLLLFGLEQLNADISENISKLAKDEIMDVIKWK